MSNSVRRGGAEVLDLVGSAPGVGAANTGRLFYDTGTQKFRVSLNGAAPADVATGAGMAIGTAITSATAGSVLFAGVAGVLQQDNANLFWDDTNNRLGIGTATPGYQLDLRQTATNTTFHIRSGATTDDGGYLTSSNGSELINSAGAIFDGVNFIAKNANATFVSLNAATVSFYTDTGLTIGNSFTPTQRLNLKSDGGLAFLNSSAAAVGPSTEARLRYSGTKLQVSNGGAAYVDVALMAAALTTGSIPFANSSGNLAQNNANLFWDDTNNRLGIGTVTPDSSLDIRNATSSISKITLRSTVTTGFADIQFFDSSNVVKMALAHGNSASGGSGQNRNFIVTYSDFLIQGSTADLLTLYHATGNLNLGPTLTDPSIKFRIEASTAAAGIEIGSGSTLAVSAASTGRYRYNSTGQKFQASLNGGTYGDVLAGDGLTFDSTNKRVGIGAATPLCLLDIRGGTASTHTIHLRGGATTNDGGYITAATADQLMLSGGASYEGGAFTARATTAEWLLMTGGGYGFYGDSGLTSGVAYTPTHRFGIAVDGGVDVATSAAAVSAAGYGRFKYIANKLQVSFNAGAYADVGTYAAALTTGSIVFANASNQLAQDNANLFWDDTNNRLGVGTATPAIALDLATGTASAGIQFRIGDTVPVSAANTGRIRYNDSTSKFQVSLNGAAYVDVATGAGAMAIGGTVTSGTVGSLLFVGTGPALAQDNANLFWDDTNDRLGIGTATPTWALHVKAAGAGVAAGKLETTATDSYTEFEYYDSSGVFKAGIGYGNSAVAVTHVQSKIFVHSAGPNVVFSNATASALEFGMTNTGVFIMLNGGQAAAVSAASTTRLRHQGVSQKFQISQNGGGYFDAATYAAALTAGSVTFANASNQLAQDNSNFFWDDTNNRLGIGNAAPAQALHVTGTVRATAGLIVDTMTAGSVWFAGASGALTQDNANFFWDDTNNRLGIGTATPAIALDLATGTAEAGIQFRIGTTLPVSAASTGRIRYNATDNVFEISKNAAAYEHMASLATAQTWTKSQNVARVALTDAANIATDASLANVFSVTLANNRTLDNPTNLVDGGTYSWIITQDATGTRTLAYGTLFKWPGGSVPVLSTAASSVDLITAVYNGTILTASINKAFA